WVSFDPTVIRWRLSNDKARPAQQRSLNQLRFAVEPIAASVAAGAATEQERKEILALANRLVELEQYPSSRVGEALEVDLKFHTLIFYCFAQRDVCCSRAIIAEHFEGKVRLRISKAQSHRQYRSTA